MGNQINYMDKDGNTRLHNAIMKDDVEYAHLLIDEEKINLNQKNSAGETPLTIAKNLGLSKIVSLIENKGGI